MITLIRIAGWIQVPLVVFHLFFWQIFGWGDDLPNLTEVNKNIMLHLHIAGIMTISFFAWISLLYPKALVNSSLGKTMLGFMTLFYLVRGVDELLIDGWVGPETGVLLMILFGLMALYAVPLYKWK